MCLYIVHKLLERAHTSTLPLPPFRARLNEREAPGKVVVARPPKRLAQLRSVSHTLVSTLQKHRSKTSKLIRFDSLHFRDIWGWPRTAVRTWLICSKRKLYHKETIFLPLCHCTTIFCVIDTLTTFIAQIVHSHMHWGKIYLPTIADENVHGLEKNVLKKTSLKSNLNRTVWSLAMGALQ